MKYYEPSIEFTSENPGVGESYLVDETVHLDPTSSDNRPPESTNPSVDVKVSVDHKKPRGLVQKIKFGRFVVGVGLAAWGAYELWQVFHGHDETHQYSADIKQKETRVYKNVSLTLAEIDSTFHLRQDTVLDRGDDALIDLNPFNYDTHIDSEITTRSSTGVTVDRLTATRDDTQKTLDIVIDGGLRSSLPAVDWNKNKLDISIGSMDIGVGTGEINKARHSAEVLVQGAGGVATACALRDNEVQDLFGEGVQDFLATTSFSDGIDLANISVTIKNYDDEADKVYDDMLKRYSDAKDSIRDRYNGTSNTFSVKDRDLTNCDRHKIVVVRHKG